MVVKIATKALTQRKVFPYIVKNIWILGWPTRMLGLLYTISPSDYRHPPLRHAVIVRKLGHPRKASSLGLLERATIQKRPYHGATIRQEKIGKDL